MAANEHVAEVEQLRKRIAELEALTDCVKSDGEVFKQKADRLEAILSACRDYIFMFDRDGRYIYASPAGIELLGMTRDRLTGKSWRELSFPPVIMEHFEVNLEVVFITGQELDGETNYPSLYGNRFYEYTLAPVKGEDGAVNYVVATVRDITKMRVLKNKLVERSKTLEGIFANTLTPMVILDRNFNFIRVNEAYAEADDREVLDFYGHNHFEFYPSECEEIFRRVVETKEPCQVYARPFIYQYNPERGVTYWDWSLAPVLDERGEVEALLLSLRDVTRSILVEKALRDSLTETRQRNAEVSALLKSSRAVLEHTGFKDAAIAIYESCRDLLGAMIGYICIKNKDGKSKVIFLEPGPGAGIVETSLPLPASGIWEEAYRTGEVLIENDLAPGRWSDLLFEGQAPFENVLHAPLVVSGESWGMMVFGNKPGGFNENDVKMAVAFSKDASIALYNSRLLDSLRHSEEHFRSVVQSATDAIITMDKNGVILFWNSAASIIFGYSHEDVVGSPLTIIMPERFCQQYAEGLAGIVHDKTPGLSGRVMETFGLRKDGSELPVELSVSRWMSGSEAYYTGIVRDVTRRKQAEEEVLKLASIVESTDDAIIGIALDGSILTWNRGAEKIYGYSAGEVKGHPVFLILATWSKEEVMHILNKIKSAENVENYDAFHIRKDSKYIHVSITISPVVNPGGEITGASLIARDITERKEMEQQLKKSHARFANILESMSDAFIALDHRWLIMHLNKEAEIMTLRPREELVGRNIWEIFPEAIGTKLYTEHLRAMAEGVTVNFEISGIFSGSIYEVSVCPSPDGLAVFYRDISGRKKMEREMARLDRLNLVGQMAAGIGHEIRNPMTAIRGFLQILSGKSECDRYREYFDLMIEELDRANSIITEFLSMARNKTAEMRMQSINSVVEALSPLLTADALNSKKDIVFALDDVPEMPLNEKEMRQLILNLVHNGLEAMPAGGRLTVRTFADGEEVVLSVQDQGKGIAPEIIEYIGVPFFTTKENGTGLGLATCYSIAARHNADIQMDTGSTGTTFSVRFRA